MLYYSGLRLDLKCPPKAHVLKTDPLLVALVGDGGTFRKLLVGGLQIMGEGVPLKGMVGYPTPSSSSLLFSWP
jgi:hypothetical protein